MRDSTYWRSLFFRSLLWSLGYVVKPDVDFSRRIVMEMDDWGTSDKGFLSYWRYPIPDEETMRTRLIAPLEKRHAIATANVITGYVDRKTRRIISPWTQKFTDVYGVQQDYAGAQRGLKAAVAAGVLEIQSHGWTHMQPDLESPPGPWWTAELAGEASVGRWYTEFEDQRRETEIAAIVQRLHMRRSLEYLREDFGQRPLSLRPGGAGWSKSYTNHTGRLAAEMGFGLFHAEPSFYCYLDRELVLDMTGIGPEASCGFERPFQFESWPRHPDGPLVLTFHDRDIALQPGFLEKLFAALPADHETQSMNQYVGFLHTRIESFSANDWQLAFTFEEPYCAYFGSHSSSWRLWLADSLREKLKARQLEVSVDGKVIGTLKAADMAGETLGLTIPTGVGRHVWKIAPGR
jgi:peptidoglycan/xylan/chitin deacetylase (PgdA/CDA1 family)